MARPISKQQRACPGVRAEKDPNATTKERELEPSCHYHSIIGPIDDEKWWSLLACLRGSHES